MSFGRGFGGGDSRGFGRRSDVFGMLHERLEKRLEKQVYFIQRGDSCGDIKIGISGNPKRRLRNIQVANSEACHILALESGGAEREAELHDMFKHLQVKGEWYSPGPELMHYIDGLSRQERGFGK